MIFTIHKNEGETPLDVLDRVRLLHGIDSNVPMTYAGRLDPLASGVLIVLTGDDVHKKESYNGLSKTYEFSILFGISTDTGDILGMVEDFKRGDVDFSEAQKIIQSFFGVQQQKYPVYSSKTVDGIPLWQYAREGKEVAVPTHEVEIFDITVLGFKEKSAEVLLREITERIQKIKGDFRQQEILTVWKNILQNKDEKFFIINCSATVSSGTYVRQLCMDIGQKLEVPALAWRIERTEIIGK